MAVVAVGATSCKKCKDCTTVTKQDGVVLQTVDVGEYCGDDLDAIDGQTITSGNVETKTTCE